MCEVYSSFSIEQERQTKQKQLKCTNHMFALEQYNEITNSK